MSLEQSKINKNNLAVIKILIDRQSALDNADSLLRLAAKLFEDAQGMCNHSDVVITRVFNQGNYYDVSSVDVTETCNICNKILRNYYDPNHRGYHS